MHHGKPCIALIEQQEQHFQMLLGVRIRLIQRVQNIKENLANEIYCWLDVVVRLLLQLHLLVRLILEIRHLFVKFEYLYALRQVFALIGRFVHVEH